MFMWSNDTIEWIDIELTSFCNIDCPGCFRQVKRKVVDVWYCLEIRRNGDPVCGVRLRWVCQGGVLLRLQPSTEGWCSKASRF